MNSNMVSEKRVREILKDFEDIVIDRRIENIVENQRAFEARIQKYVDDVVSNINKIATDATEPISFTSPDRRKIE